MDLPCNETERKLMMTRGGKDLSPLFENLLSFFLPKKEGKRKMRNVGN